jgi:hypothetical protein
MASSSFFTTIPCAFSVNEKLIKSNYLLW